MTLIMTLSERITYLKEQRKCLINLIELAKEDWERKKWQKRLIELDNFINKLEVDLKGE